MSVERVYALLELNTAMRKDFDDRHMIFPHITFTCSGEVVQWIVAGKWDDDEEQYPELQIWRPSEGTAYMKLNSTSLSPDGREDDDVYEYRADPPLPFQPGDVLGVWQPDKDDSKLRVRYYDNAGDSVYYYTEAAGNSGSFDTTANGVIMDTGIPLVTVEIGKY